MSGAGKRVRVEIVCGTVDDARAAAAGGADRIELCAAVGGVGGVTPSLGLLRAVKAATPLPVMTMVRPRPGGFRYAPSDLSVMLADAAWLVESGADGLVFGALLPDGRIDADATRRLVEAASGRETVFHRAFDITPDPHEALETLIACGVSRVLSSGQAGDALSGADTLRALVARSAGRIEVLAGGGVRAHNVREIVARSGVDQVHLAPLTPRRDPTATAPARGIDYGDDGMVAAEAVAAVVGALNLPRT